MSSKLLCAAAAAVAASLTLGVADASARITLRSFTSAPATTQAGAHDDFRTEFTFGESSTGGVGNGPKPSGTLRDVRIDMPAGLAGSAIAVPHCTDLQLSQHQCPVDTQVGVLGLYFASPSTNPPQLQPVYNMTPRRGEVAKLGIDLGELIADSFTVSVRDTSDFGLHAELDELPSQVVPALFGAELDLWGVPADPSHDADRYPPGSQVGTPSPPGASSGAPLTPFLTNPSDCSGTPLTSSISVDDYQEPGRFVSATAQAPAMTRCDRLTFGPSLSAQADVTRADSPSGYGVTLRVPQNPNAKALATPDVKDVSVTLPLGTALSPSVADGLGSCSDEDLAAAACPSTSKVGAVTVSTPLLGDQLQGSAYIGRPLDGNRFRLFLVASAPGVTLRLRGSIAPDPSTGQLTTTFAANPQIPFSELDLQLQGGPRAPLVNPPGCGTATTSWTITSWAGQTRSGSDSFAVDGAADGGPCPASAPFAPGFSAGTIGATAGASSPFTLTFSRADGEQPLGGLSVSLPEGLLGRIDSVPLCPEAQAVNGGCGAASQIGSVSTAAGPGATPLHLPGRVYLTGPYGGGPFGLAIVVPAVAGPYDLGTVVVRAAIFVDPVTTALRVVSDPLPQILDGVPLRLRSVTVTLDRPGFMVSPTDCTPTSIAATVSSASGAAFATGSPFHVDGCGSLAYAPKLALALSGNGQTTDGKHPALRATLTPRADDANTGKVAVRLPLSLALDPDNAQALCEPAAADADACPAASIVGHASARSILPDPVEGPVYFVRGVRTDPKTGRQIKTLPKLYVPLRADGVTIVVRASSSVEDGHLVTTFDGLPDVPLSAFTLDVDGGTHGILVVSHANLCAKTQLASGSFTGQNDVLARSEVTMGTPCALGVAATSHSSTTLRVTVGGIGPGRVVVSGAGIAKSARTLSAATSATLAARLTKATRRALARGHAVRVKLTVAFTPRGATKAKTTRKTVTLHPAAKRRR